MMVVGIWSPLLKPINPRKIVWIVAHVTTAFSSSDNMIAEQGENEGLTGRC